MNKRELSGYGIGQAMSHTHTSPPADGDLNLTNRIRLFTTAFISLSFWINKWIYLLKEKMKNQRKGRDVSGMGKKACTSDLSNKGYKYVRESMV